MPQAEPGIRIGHVHLKVADLDRAISFYRDVIGLEVRRQYGDQAAFLAADGYHHHLGLNTWDSRGGTAPPPGHTGLYHTAFLFPDRAALGRALRRALDAGVDLTGASDHGVSEAIYFDDPDGNGVEIYRDRAVDDWPRDADGNVAMTRAPLDIPTILAAAATAD